MDRPARWSFGRAPRRGFRPELLLLEGRLAPATLTPDQVRHAYGIDAIPAFAGALTADGAGQTIAIVDAYHNPNLASDLAVFNSTYGTAANELNARPVSGAGGFLRVVDQTGGTTPPPTDPTGGWEAEEALDVEWAHAVAPMADIILVECNGPSTASLYAGIRWAAAHAPVVSASWGGGEYPGETSDDTGTFFNPHAGGSPGVSFVFSAGDAGQVEYPSASPDVLSVGATNLALGGGGYGSETGWSYNPGSQTGGGGGASAVEPRPSYQDAVSSVVGSHRGTPDVSYNGGPGSPVWVYNTYQSGGWGPAWGTSAAAPQWAGLIALIDQGRAQAGLQPLNSTTGAGLTNFQLQTNLYALPTADFHDVTGGTNAGGDSAAVGYDLLTGLGTPVADLLVPDMVGYTTTSLQVGSPSPTAFSAVRLTATVTGRSVAPTGSVDFKLGTLDLGAVPLVNGSATLTTAALPAGSNLVTAYYVGDVNYAASSGGRTVTVSTAGTTTSLSASSPTETYGQTETLTATVSGVAGHTPTGLVDFRLGSLDLGTVALSGGSATLATSALPAGSDALSVVYLGDPNYATSSGSAGVAVSPARLTVAADAESKLYGAAVPSLTYSVTGLVNGDAAGSVLSGAPATAATAASGVGIYPITQGSLAANGNYALVFSGNTLLVTPAPLAVTADPQVKAYGAAVPPLTFTAGGFVNGDTAGTALTGSLATTAAPWSSVGTYAIVRGSLAAANYAILFTGNALTVTPAPLAVTADPQTKVYGAALPVLTRSVSGLVNGDAASAVLTGSLATTATPGSGVGPYPITQGTLSLVSGNYTLSFTGGTLTVTPAPLTVTADDLTAAAGQLLPPLTYTVTGLVNGDTPAVLSGVSLSTAATPDSPAGRYPITAAGGRADNYTVTDRPGTLTVAPPTPLPPPPADTVSLTGSPDFAAGAGPGGPPVAILYNPDGSVRFSQVVFDPSFTGGVRVAAADLTGDGRPDLVVGTGPGATAEVRVIDGVSGLEVARFQPFEAAFTGGVYVTTGSLTPDGVPDLIVTPDQGGGPRVEVYELRGSAPVLVANFFGIDDPSFRGGARAAVGDINGDGRADLVVAAGFGGGPRVTAYDGASLGSGAAPVALFNLFVFEPGLRNGVFVAAGDVDGDGRADLIVGGGPGGGPRVEVLSGAGLAGGGGPAVLANFFAGDPANRGGVGVAVKDLDGDRFADLVVGDGGGAGTRVTAYRGRDLASGGSPQAFALDAFPGETGGVFVG